MTAIDLPPEYDTLLGLVARYSPSGQEAQAVAWLVEHMQRRGWSQAFRDEAGSAVGILGDGQRQIVLLGHIDTVPGEIPLRLETDPANPPGILHGRGVVDAKGPLAAFVEAASQAGPLPGWQVVVIGAVDEERNSTGARHAVARYRPAYAIIGEPSHWERLTLGYKGIAWAEIAVQRTLTHTSSGQESACEAAVKLWQQIEAFASAFNQDRKRSFDQVLPTLRGLSSTQDGFSEQTGLRVGVRLPVDLPPQDWYARLQELAGDAQVTPQGFAIPACQVEKNTPLVRAFLAAIRSNGGQPGFVLKGGTSDLNIVAPQWNCPALVYGPGDSALDHTPYEHLSLEEYRRAVQVLKQVLLSLTQS